MLRGKVKQNKERLRWLRKLLLSKDRREESKSCENLGMYLHRKQPVSRPGGVFGTVSVVTRARVPYELMPCSGPTARARRQAKRLGQVVNWMKWDGDLEQGASS